jgi:LacI family transcriptional regulator
MKSSLSTPRCGRQRCRRLLAFGCFSVHVNAFMIFFIYIHLVRRENPSSADAIDYSSQMTRNFRHENFATYNRLLIKATGSRSTHKQMKKPSIHDVAKAAGVSIATVSRVVNGDAAVKPETRTTVLNAINLLQYRPGISARLMGGQRSFWVALLYQNPVFNYIHSIQDGAEEACRQGGYMLSVHACQQTGPALEQEVRGIVEAFRPAGVILTLPLSTHQGLCDLLRELEVPCVRIAPERFKDGTPQVYFDEVLAAKRMTEHLISLGHKRIGLIAGLPKGNNDGVAEGFTQAMNDAGLAIAPTHIGSALFQFDIAVQIARQMLMQADPPTALLAANDDMAAGCIRAAYQLGLKVPEQLSVAGFGDSYVAQIMSPRLTAVQEPARDMAKMAVEMIVSGRAKQRDIPPVILSHRLVIGESSGPVEPQ